MKHFAILGGVLTESAMELIRKNILQINTIVRKAFPRDRDVKKAYQVREKCRVTRNNISRVIVSNISVAEIKHDDKVSDSASSIWTSCIRVQG